jgi:CPA2 family monovalent cation:H+ antiporter-2
VETWPFLQALALVLGTAGLTTVLCQAGKLPVVLGYLVAGLIVGPYTPIPVLADRAVIQGISELGVIMLMFALGLEFRLRKLFAVLPNAGVIAVVAAATLLSLGVMLGHAFGWTDRESVFLGAIIAISSTTIIAKAFDEQGVKGKLRDLVVGVLIVEDLIAILLMASLTAVAGGDEVSASLLVQSSVRLGLFLALLIGFGLLVVPRVMRYVVRLNRPETTLVATVAICFGFAELAHEFRYSVALGAFLAGSLVAESGHEHEIEPLVRPVRDILAAIFFVSVGMLLEPAQLTEHWLPILILFIVILVATVVSVSIAGFLSGHDLRTSIRTGMSLAQIGEFSFIIATLGISLGSTRPFMFTIAVAVSILTTLTTPWMIQYSDRVAIWVESRLPRAIQTFASFYGNWLGDIRAARKRSAGEPKSRTRHLVRRLVIDALSLVALGISSAFFAKEMADELARRTGASLSITLPAVIAIAIVLAIPFGLGIIRLARQLAVVLAASVMPSRTDNAMDLAEAPRRTLVVTLQLAIVLLVGLPLVIAVEPFIPGLPAAITFAVIVLLLAFGFWKSAANFHGHVTAGAEMMAELLATKKKDDSGAVEEQLLNQVRDLLPGFGAPNVTRVSPDSPAVGSTLAALDLRGQTGATVLAIVREGQSILLPGAEEILHAGDMLALAGPQESIALAIKKVGLS